MPTFRQPTALDPRARVYLNRIVAVVPPTEAHAKFVEYVPTSMSDERERRAFMRLAAKAQIERRYSVMQRSPSADGLDARGDFTRARFPTTARRMELYKEAALPLAVRAVGPLIESVAAEEISHVIVTSCTGFYAPGLDLELQREFRLRPTVERSIIGFMGCYAAFNGLRAAWHVVRSRPEAKVLMVNLELCTLHLQEDFGLERVLASMQFADGCAASLISAEPTGFEIHEMHSAVVSEASDLITWDVGDFGFNMHLSTKVPQALGEHVPALVEAWLGARRELVTEWAVHPGGRAILDVVEDRLRVSSEQMRASREVLRDYGNMSSATIMFVLQRLMSEKKTGGLGVAMAFGPGLTMESMLFERVASGART